MHQIYTLIQRLRATNSRNRKLEILKEYHEDYDIQRFLEMTYGVYYQHIKYLFNIEDFSTNVENSLTILDLMDYIEETSFDEVSKESLITLISLMNYQDVELCILLLRRNLNVGINKKTISLVWNNLILNIPHQCEMKFNMNYLHSFSFPAKLELKSKGKFCNVILKYNEEIKCLTKSGNTIQINNLNLIDQLYEIRIIAGMDVVLHVIIKDLNSKEMCMEIHDIINLNDWNIGKTNYIYINRFKSINAILKLARALPNIKQVETYDINSLDELKTLSKTVNTEGSILKYYNSIWKNGINNQWLKLNRNINEY